MTLFHGTAGFLSQNRMDFKKDGKILKSPRQKFYQLSDLLFRKGENSNSIIDWPYNLEVALFEIRIVGYYAIRLIFFGYSQVDTVKNLEVF